MEEKEIYARLTDPKISIIKGFRNDRQKGYVLTCKNTDGCEIYKHGECAMIKGICPYGLKRLFVGFTARACKYYSWAKNFRETHKACIESILTEPKTICNIGEYVFIPISYWNINNVHRKFIECEGGVGDRVIIKKDIFNAEFIKKNIIEFHAESWFSRDEIKEYQTEQVPKFIRQLKEYNIELFNEVASMLPNDERFIKIKNVGRKALLQTLTPNTGVFIIDRTEYTYDGKYLYSDKKNLFVINGKFLEIRVQPVNDLIVEITAEEQVNKNTKFID